MVSHYSLQCRRYSHTRSCDIISAKLFLNNASHVRPNVLYGSDIIIMQQFHSYVSPPPPCLPLHRNSSLLFQHINRFCLFHDQRILVSKHVGDEKWRERFVELTLFEHTQGAYRGHLKVHVPTRHFIRRNFFVGRIIVKVTVVRGSLHLETQNNRERMKENIEKVELAQNKH